MFPVVNTPATIHHGSDSVPATVVSVNRNIVGVKQDEWRVVSGSEANGSAEYEYSRSLAPHAYVDYFRFRNGKWEGVTKNEKGRWVKNNAFGKLGLGYRRRYFDPHF